MADIIKTLAELRDSFIFTSKYDVEYAIGAAIKTMGPEIILQLIPLEVSDFVYVRVKLVLYSYSSLLYRNQIMRLT